MKQFYTTEQPFVLESGGMIEQLTIAYHTYGTLNKKKSNVVWVVHGLTANSDVFTWWEGLFGEKHFFNPEEYFIICVNAIGSPYGSSSPQNLDFPLFTVRDLVSAYFMLAKQLKIDAIQILIGGSFGGSQALEFAYSFQGQIEKLILIASAAKESAWTIAIHESQRMALKADASFGKLNEGIEGLKAARAIGMVSYRTYDAFVEQQTDTDEKLDAFKVSSYMNYQGEKLVKRFNSLAYYYLSKCMDSHDIGRGRGGQEKALKDIKIPSLIIGIASDQLIPVSLQQFIHQHIPNSSYQEINSIYGHDGFLIETNQIQQHILYFLSKDD